ncbi:hypothetical protein [Deinococcus rufus]|uniref:Uncharacterized protein n=1 Tax=Deinococcus rufus TaxID=2136097 RepID=A0ABV7Z7P8_9DEIO
MTSSASTTKTGYATTDRRARYCGGALIYGHAVNRDLVHARLATLWGLWSPDQLDLDAPVFTDPEAFLNHHGAES